MLEHNNVLQQGFDIQSQAFSTCHNINRHISIHDSIELLK